MLSSILSGASALAGLAGGIGGNKQKAMPGAQTRPMADSLKDIDKLRAWLEQNMQYIQRPTRRLTAPELEGPFAPVAVREIQNYFDAKYPNRGTETESGAGSASTQPFIMGKEDAGQKGGAPGYYKMSDGTRVSEHDLDLSKLEGYEQHRGMIPADRMIGMKYGSAPTGGGLTSQELEALRRLIGAQSGNI
jgi:hypothetical protein